MEGHICGPSVYKYMGWQFEIHSYCGPWPHKANGEPRKKAGAKFWEVYAEFNKLSQEEKDKCRVHTGGCQEI